MIFKHLAVFSALCLGVALCRPGIIKEIDSKDGQEPSILRNIELAASNADPKAGSKAGPNPGPNPDSKPKPDPESDHWYEALEKFVKIQLSSMGSVGNNPAEGGGIDGKTYHKLSFGFGENKDYVIYLDHILNYFKKGNGGILSVGYHSPLPYIGAIDVRGSEDFDNFGKGGLDWRIDMDDETWKNYVN